MKVVNIYGGAAVGSEPPAVVSTRLPIKVDLHQIIRMNGC